jgi:hypothetical protein
VKRNELFFHNFFFLKILQRFNCEAYTRKTKINFFILFFCQEFCNVSIAKRKHVQRNEFFPQHLATFQSQNVHSSDKNKIFLYHIFSFQGYGIKCFRFFFIIHRHLHFFFSCAARRPRKARRSGAQRPQIPPYICTVQVSKKRKAIRIAPSFVFLSKATDASAGTGTDAGSVVDPKLFITDPDPTFQ